MSERAVRQEWLRTLAKASLGDLETAWKQLGSAHSFETLRATETGLAMIRGRADGTGCPFNLGEATVTRSVVSTHDSWDGSEITGVGYILGRDKRHAELLARLDAVFQDKGTRAITRETLLQSIQLRQECAAAVAAQKTASTRVEFFTMVRGE